MSKILAKANNKLTALYVKGMMAAKNAADDVSGSDTTEKIGMVVVAIVIVGLLAAAVKQFMPGLFSSIFGTAQQKLENIF